MMLILSFVSMLPHVFLKNSTLPSFWPQQRLVSPYLAGFSERNFGKSSFGDFPPFFGGATENGFAFGEWYTVIWIETENGLFFFGGGKIYSGYLVNTPPTPWKIHSMHLEWPIHGYTVIPCKWPIHENWVFYNQIHELVTSDDPLNLPGSNWDRLLGKNVEVKQLGTKNPWRILFTPGN